MERSHSPLIHPKSDRSNQPTRLDAMNAFSSSNQAELASSGAATIRLQSVVWGLGLFRSVALIPRN
jgi:hypothetical protein